MKKLITCFTLFSLVVLSSCSNDQILENIITFKNRIDYLRDYYMKGFNKNYYGSYTLNSYLLDNNSYEILTINGNLINQYSVFQNNEIEINKTPSGEFNFKLIKGDLLNDAYSSLEVNLNFKSNIFYTISYFNKQNEEDNFNGKYYLNNVINLSFDFNNYLVNLDGFINDYYPKISLNENTLIEANIAKSIKISNSLIPYSSLDSYYKTYLSVVRDIDTNDNLINKGIILEYVSYFDIYPYLEETNTSNNFTNGQLEKISRTANFTSNDNSKVFIFNEEFSANRYEEYIYEEPNKIDYELIENTNLSYITLSYKSNLRDILNLLA